MSNWLNHLPLNLILYKYGVPALSIPTHHSFAICQKILNFASTYRFFLQ